MNIVVGIPTAGRRAQLSMTLKKLAHQSRMPERILVCPAQTEDFDEAESRLVMPPIEKVVSARGLSAQRNAILRKCGTEDLLVYFDDDFYPVRTYLEEAIRLFEQNAEVVIATHHPSLDGASGCGVSDEQAERELEMLESAPLPQARIEGVYAAYGCNMVVRLAPVREHQLCFDENLPLYSWLEDVDFSRSVSEYGQIVEYNRLRGVHLGSKKGRTSGVRLGYSQIANPVYMLKKGSLSTSYAVRQMGRNVMKNVLRLCWPEPWVDRAGRLRGNTIALQHLITHRLHPMNVTELE